MDWSHEFNQILLTVIYAVIGFALLGAGVFVMEKITPFSIRKEIEEDQNTALGIIIAGAMIAIGIMIAAVIR
jgi:putative membrane protein